MGGSISIKHYKFNTIMPSVSGGRKVIPNKRSNLCKGIKEQESTAFSEN